MPYNAPRITPKKNKRKGSTKTYSRKKYASKGRGTVTRSYKPRLPHIHPFALAQVNPFLDCAFGGRIPDPNTMPSETFYQLERNGCQADTTYGCGARAYSPNVAVYGHSTSTTASQTSWTWNATFGGTFATSDITDIRAHYTAARCVSHGVKIMSPENANVAQGYLHVCVYPASRFTGVTTWSEPTSVAQMMKCPSYRRFTLQSLIHTPVIVPNKFLDPTAFGYKSVADDNTSVVATSGVSPFTNGWGTIVVAIEGGITGGNATKVDVEHIAHWEGLKLISATNTNDNISAAPADFSALGAASATSATSTPTQSPAQAESGPGGYRESIQVVVDAVGNTTANAAAAFGRGFGEGLGSSFQTPPPGAPARDRYGKRGAFVPYFNPPG